ncbi:MAG: GYD domain-containing protein [Geminicoccaceae bacterium]
MPTFITLATWTEQGIKDVKQSGARYDAFKALVESKGGAVRSLYMTMGAHDLIVTYDLPSDDAAAEVALTLGQGGNIRTQTLKAFDEDAYRRLTAGL